ncbi:ABC-type multidrug transport system, ATPase component [Tenacibaculum sp. MAR_2009_124]|uniref:ABC transporter ATP-binding protein n=1 Tax=Tenacibaculum sp. MAR_2009_124 TaxID=1250059 RepID=UPI000898E83D|nr:ABC transporter ATP-binding protein [Tenacibaculum sp. MAR_2009_124]SEB45108.1 ABC-type multidrug transport system, ATPase component [Tenacibaculum sp. MAR_2009_124]
MNNLTIKNITKQYANGVNALNKASLELNNGLFGLLGPNGAGKSSLMRTIATLQEPTSGTVSFNGVDCIQNPQVLRSQLGYLPQEFGVYPKVNAEDLLHHLAVLKGVVSKGERKDQVNALLEQTNLYNHRKKSVNTFSGGMRQRFGIAQALLGAPKLIIVDEPTAGLDPEERNRFLNLLSEIGENVIIILSTHLVEDVRDLCNKMAILNKGRIVVQGNPIDLTETLLNKTWVKTIAKSEIEIYQENYHVLSTRLLSGKTQIQILSEENPGNNFNIYKPDLESVYFSYLNPILK